MTDKYDPKKKEDDDQKQLQAQLEAQAQAQAELQAQLQGQGQGQGQAEWQGQHQESSNYNVNGNINCDSNSNENANCNVNANNNTSVTTVCVDVKVSDQICQTPAQTAPDIDLSCLNICDNKGIVNLMPEDNYQYLSGGDNSNNTVFHLDQVNNLVNNGHDIAQAATAAIGGIGPVTGGSVAGSEAATNIASSELSQSSNSSANVDGIAQSITLGANVQVNNLTWTGHDSVVADHGSVAHHDSV